MHLSHLNYLYKFCNTLSALIGCHGHTLALICLGGGVAPLGKAGGVVVVGGVKIYQKGDISERYLKFHE